MVNNGRNYSNNDTVEIVIPGDNIRFQVYVDPKRLFPEMTPVGGTHMYPFHAVTDYRNHDSEDASNIMALNTESPTSTKSSMHLMI